MLQQIIDFVQSALLYSLPYLGVLAVVIFIHEMGHFLVARWCGVKVLTFSMGFGPELWHRFDKHGTRWRLAAVPLGGYVKFYGDENAASAPARDKLAKMSAKERRLSFSGQPVLKRSAIVAAGPIANFILTIAIFAGTFYFVGRPITVAQVDRVAEGSAAQKAGFQVRDLILAIDGSTIESFSDMQRIVRISPDRTLNFRVLRDGREIDVQATPQRQEVKDVFGQVHRIGIIGISRSEAAGDVRHKNYGLGEALVAGVQETWFVVDRTFDYIGGVITGRESADQISGPIRIAQVSGQAAKLGFDVLLNLTAVLSVSIGLLNLFPIPLLDGGHLLYYAIEAVRGRPLSEKAQEFGFRIGIALVLTLMLFATWNDILSFNRS
ncbi:zinc metalloprotease [Terrihabitans soli]|uniref:Zinc metalloprotease n=1 Tax=Terrihabitans soli TaxID=708113 RepID=A0A6S6QU45_9HYPH|nr:RIP metalloprotease RseP [Terrihabitans soli]BCJ90772.1 zinc metalloprotease [Terrihabitans soli]